MDLQEARGILGQHWGAFVAAVNDPQVRAVPGGVQMYVWQTLSNDYLSRGESLPANSFQAVNTLLSNAGAERRARLNFQDARNRATSSGLDQAITSDMHSPGIDSRRLGEQPLGPSFRVTYDAVFVDEAGNDVPLRLNWYAGTNLPESVGGLQDYVNGAAAVMADEYELSFSGVASPVGIQSY